MLHVVIILQSFHCQAPQSYTGDELAFTGPVGATTRPAARPCKGTTVIVCRWQVSPPHQTSAHLHRHSSILHIRTIHNFLRQVGFGQLHMVRDGQGCTSLLVGGREEVMGHQGAQLWKGVGGRCWAEVHAGRWSVYMW